MLYHISVAHSELYGYGFRPYEYLPPPGSDNYTTAQTQEHALGMYSLRSCLLPKLFILVAYITDSVGLIGHHLMVNSAFCFPFCKIFKLFALFHK